MRRSLALLIPFVALCSPARAEDTIPAETVVAVKHATVFIRVEGTGWKGSGSGFVVATPTRDVILIATNAHVVAGPEFDRVKLGPPALMKSLKGNTITAIFDSGTKTELSVKAELVAADQERDLAVIRVTGLKVAPPTPIAYTDPPKPVETMSIITFGYPLGDTLSVGKGNPAITVGKGSVSSLRNDDDGDLKLVQIDASVNPGNSGGPVVDTKGKLVGVVVSGYRGAQGLNFAIPAAELGKMMKGRLDEFKLTATKAADGKVSVKAEVGVIDPTITVRGGYLYYAVVAPKGIKPKPGEPLEKFSGAKKVTMKIDSGLAIGDLAIDKAEGELYVQAIPDTGALGATKVERYPLAIPANATGPVVLGELGVTGGPGAGEVDPPAGWKEHTATNKTFKVWIPEKCNRFNERQHTYASGALRVAIHEIVAEQGAKTFMVEQVLFPPRGLDRDEAMKMCRDIAMGKELGAKVVRESDAKMGKFPGKEWLIQAGGSATRARGFVIGNSVYLLRSIGTRAFVDSEDSMTFLESCRLQVPNRPPVGPVGPPGQQTEAIAGGAATDPQFTDLVPAQAKLVGFEVALGEDGMNPTVRAVRPIYRANDKQTLGEWQGMKKDAKELVKVVAKTGYAVGAITVKPGTNVAGFMVKFMKIAGDKLDPNDNYESEWIGTKDGPGPAPTTLGGKSDAPRGVLGRTNATGVTGLGLKYPDAVVVQPPPDVGMAKAIGVGTEPYILGSIAHDPKFKTVGPEGAILIGLEARFEKFGNTDIVRAVRPIYRVNGKEEFGKQFGNDLTNSVTLKAKDGYAIGGITGKAGWWCNGFSVTFMKVKADGTLDPKDSYESEWVGFNGKGEVFKVTSDGTPVVGIVGKIVGPKTTALGLLFKGQEAWDPNAGKP